MSKCQTYMCIQCLADLLFKSSKTCLIRHLVNPLLIFIPILTFSLFVRNPSHCLFQHKISLPASACWIRLVSLYIYCEQSCISCFTLFQSELKSSKSVKAKDSENKRRSSEGNSHLSYYNILQFLFSSLGNANGMDRKETCYCDFTFKHGLAVCF